MTNSTFKRPSVSAKMTRLLKSSLAAIFILGITEKLSAQGTTTASTNADNLLILVFLACMVMLAFVFIVMSDRMLKLIASTVLKDKHGASDEQLEAAYSLMPKAGEIIPVEPKEGKIIKLSRGMDIKVNGKAHKTITDYHAASYALKPTNFNGLQPIPKVEVEEGAQVKAGDKIFYDKKIPDVFFTAPVSGQYVELRRGAKRAVNEIVILADKDIQYKQFPTEDPNTLSREQVMERMLDSGTWVSLIERPFGVIASREQQPRDIFISCFDSAPLAPNYNFALAGKVREFQAGIDALSKLTIGKVHLGMNAKEQPADTFAQAANCEKHWFEGPHPAGNVGVQIHHVAPINKGETVWTMDPQDVITLGRLFLDGIYRPERIVAVAGPSVVKPHYFRTIAGANVEGMLKDNLQDVEENDEMNPPRIISGNVLTGKKIEENGFLGFFHNTLSAIPEGDFYEFMGWILPSYPRPSTSITFPWKMMDFASFNVNTNTHGEKRAFVVTGEYEAVCPMDIYPVHLLKAILAQDFEKIEGLGIYEVLEEDFALCEFACTSKQPAQAILRSGLNYMQSQS